MTDLSTPRAARWFWPVLIAIVAVYALGFVGSRPLADPDEGRYAAAAWSMIESGDWLVPHLDGRPHLTKSPAAYWSAALGMLAVGRSEAGARAGIGCAFGLWIVCAAVCALRWHDDRRAAWIAALALGTAPLAVVGGSILTTDPWLAVMQALAATAALVALEDAAARRLAIGWFWIALGAGFFVKGPPALLVLPALLWAWPRRHEPGAGDRLFPWIPFSCGAVLGLWWYLWISYTEPSAARVLLQDEFYRRLLTDQMRRNGPFWMPLAVLLLGTLPWNLSWFGALNRPRWRAQLRLDRSARARLWFGWIGSSLVIFMLSRSRQPLYVLPLAFPLVIPVAGPIARWSEQRRTRRAALALLGTVLLLLWAWLRLDGDSLPRYRHSRTLAELIHARHDAGPDGVVLLQSRLLPGLTFYLGHEPLHVAWKRADWDDPHDLDRNALLARLRRGERIVVVGGSAQLDKFPADLRLTRRVFDPASGMDVAVAGQLRPMAP